MDDVDVVSQGTIVLFAVNGKKWVIRVLDLVRCEEVESKRERDQIYGKRKGTEGLPGHVKCKLKIRKERAQDREVPSSARQWYQDTTAAWARVGTSRPNSMQQHGDIDPVR